MQDKQKATIAALFENLEWESELILRIAQKDSEAMSALYDLHAGKVYGCLLKWTHSKEEAEDILQDVFLQVWQKASSFDLEKGKVLVWLTTIARNKAIDKLRREGTRRAKKDDVIKSEEGRLLRSRESPLDQVIQRESRRAIQEAMEALQPGERRIIQMHYFGGLTHSEVSKALSMPLGSVKSRLRKSKMVISKHLRKRNFSN